METYILKALLCSSVLIVLYYLFLEKEKSFQFNRFYLIFALLFSYVIPLINLKLPAKETPKSGMVFQESVSDMMVIPAQTVESTMDWSLVLISIYAGIAFLLLLKSIYSIYKILSLKGNLVRVHGQKTKVLVEEISPFSFMGTLYIGKNYISAENRIDERIFLHERVHITQKHSLDLILLEILKIISWFNPALYFYKKAIVTNHEFLADEHVVSNNFDVPSYQKLILKEISTRNNLQFSNQFNYNNTKKRFIMMTKTKTKFTKTKKFLAIATFVILAFLFVNKVHATTNNVDKPIFSTISTSITSDDENGKPYEEFLEIITKYDDIVKSKDAEKFLKTVPRDELVKLAELWKQLGSEDINKIPILISYQQISKEIPTQKQLNQFLSKRYSIEIDGKEIENQMLTRYKNTDFFSVYTVKILPTNPDFGKHEVGVVLYTKEFAKKYNAKKEISVGFKVSEEEYKTVLKQDTIKKPNVEKKAVEVNKEVSYKTPSSPPTSAMTEVDELPEFPGGINAFRSQISSSFNGAVFKGDEGLIKTEIYFVVEKDGTISDISAQGQSEIFNKEAENAAKKANENQTWKPAMKDGKPVRYRFRIPMEMTFGS